MNSITLPNGLRLCHIPRFDTEVVSARLVTRLGSWVENHMSVPQGTLHYLEHILNRGSNKYQSELELKNIIKKNGGKSNASTSYNAFYFTATTLTEYEEDIFEFFAEAVFGSILDKDLFDKERILILTELEKVESNHDIYFMSRGIEAARYGVMSPRTGTSIGTRESVQSIAYEHIKKLYSLYSNPAIYVLYIGES
jgi:zinc protease